MFPPFWFPTIRAPFSGDVTQEIVPRVFSPDIKGSAEIEARIQSEVASYGKQLGKILEALQLLSSKAKVPLPEIEQLIADVEAVKATSKDVLRAEAISALEKLKSADEDAWREVVEGQT